MLVNFWWGSVFLLAVPVMIVLLIVGPRILPEHRDPNPGRFDLLSAGMSLAAVLLAIYGLKKIAESGLGWPPALTMVLGLAIGAGFVLRQRKLADPLIDLNLFRNPAFSASLATYTLGIFAAFGTFLFIAQYLQLVLGLTPLMAGLWSIPGAVAFIVGSNLAPKVVRRVRPAFVVAGGLVLAAAGLAMLTQIGDDSLLLVVAANTIMSIGFSFTFTLTIDLVIGAAPEERAGSASALAETGAEFGGALGLAILGSLGIAVYRSGVAAGLPPGIPANTADAIQETLGGAVHVAGQLPAPLAAAVLDVANASYIQGMQLTSLIGAVVMLGLVVLTSVMLRDVGREGESRTEMDAAQNLQPATIPVRIDP